MLTTLEQSRTITATDPNTIVCIILLHGGCAGREADIWQKNTSNTIILTGICQRAHWTKSLSLRATFCLRENVTNAFESACDFSPATATTSVCLFWFSLYFQINLFAESSQLRSECRCRILREPSSQLGQVVRDLFNYSPTYLGGAHKRLIRPSLPYHTPITITTSQLLSFLLPEPSKQPLTHSHLADL